MSMPLSHDLVQTMSLNILPNAKTVLHFITRNFEFLQRFLEEVAIDSSGDEQSKFYVPFIEDINGMTPLHYAMGRKPQDLENQDEERIEEHKDEAD